MASFAARLFALGHLWSYFRIWRKKYFQNILSLSLETEAYIEYNSKEFPILNSLKVLLCTSILQGVKANIVTQHSPIYSEYSIKKEKLSMDERGMGHNNQEGIKRNDGTDKTKAANSSRLTDYTRNTSGSGRPLIAPNSLMYRIANAWPPRTTESGSGNQKADDWSSKELTKVMKPVDRSGKTKTIESLPNQPLDHHYPESSFSENSVKSFQSLDTPQPFTGFDLQFLQQIERQKANNNLEKLRNNSMKVVITDEVRTLSHEEWGSIIKTLPGDCIKQLEKVRKQIKAGNFKSYPKHLHSILEDTITDMLIYCDDYKGFLKERLKKPIKEKKGLNDYEVNMEKVVRSFQAFYIAVDDCCHHVFEGGSPAKALEAINKHAQQFLSTKSYEARVNKYKTNVFDLADIGVIRNAIGTLTQNDIEHFRDEMKKHYEKIGSNIDIIRYAENYDSQEDEFRRIKLFLRSEALEYGSMEKKLAGLDNGIEKETFDKFIGDYLECHPVTTFDINFTNKTRHTVGLALNEMKPLAEKFRKLGREGAETPREILEAFKYSLQKAAFDHGEACAKYQHMPGEAEQAYVNITSNQLSVIMEVLDQGFMLSRKRAKTSSKEKKLREEYEDLF